MVTHEHRYSDLRKFIYTAPAQFVFGGNELNVKDAITAPGLDDSPNFSFVHPVASLGNRSRGMPTDLTLEARDCLLLYKSMAQHQTAEYPIDLALAPTAAMPDLIRKANVLQWETKLKKLLAE